MFEDRRNFLFKNLSVLLQLSYMSFLKSLNRLLIFLLYLDQSLVPLVVEFLIFFNVRLFHLLSFLGLVEYQLLSLSLEVLQLQLLNSVFGHFSLYKQLLEIQLLSEGSCSSQDTYQHTSPPSHIAFCVLLIQHYIKE